MFPGSKPITRARVEELPPSPTATGRQARKNRSAGWKGFGGRGPLPKPGAFRWFLPWCLSVVLFVVPFWTRSLAAQGRQWELSDDWAETHSLKVFSATDGLPQNSVNDILQTRDGYVWLATFGGVARFDGVRFVTFDMATTPGIPNNRALSLLEARDGTLWVGFEGGQVGRKPPGGLFEEVPFPPGQELDFVSGLTEDGTGRIWMGGPGGLFHFSEGGGSPVWMAARLIRRSCPWRMVSGPTSTRVGSDSSARMAS